MTTANNDYIPTDYEDLYRYYIIGDGRGNSLCDKLIRHYLPHGSDDEKETLRQDVFLRIFEKELLKSFDPKLANFGGVIFFVTRTICVNHLSKKSRNPVTGLCGGTLTTKDADEDTFEPGMYNLDRLFGSETPEYENHMFAVRVLKELRTWATALHIAPRHKRDESLLPLIDLLAKQYDPKECGEELGVTASTISNWMSVLKTKTKEIQAALG